MKPLQKFIDDAKRHRQSIKDLVPGLRTEPNKCLVYLDFTKFTIVEDGSVNCFVISLLSGPGKYDKHGRLVDYHFFSSLGVWKPTIRYYDFYAQSVKKETEDRYKVKQIFPYVKVCMLVHRVSNSYLVAKMTEETSKSKVTYCILY
jgi:hypothetical protein